MNTRVAGIVVGLLLAGVPAFAQDSNAAKHVAATAANAHGSAAKKRVANKPAAEKPGAEKPVAKKPTAQKSRIAATAATAKPAADKASPATSRKLKSAAKAVHTSAVPAAYTAVPEAERFAIQSDLAWLGDYDATAAGDVDARTINAIKAYQKRHGEKETGSLSGEERAALAEAVKAPEAAVGWRLVDDAATGARLGVPTLLVPQTGAARIGSRWTSAHGQIQVETFRLHEAALPALFDEEKKTPRHRAVEYSEFKPDSFVISGMQGLKKFRVRVEARGPELRGITILYDQATEGIMAPVALAMANTFQGFPDANAAPLPGRKRSVEYATAIVVSGQGHLLTLGQVTDECQSITVPGFGHAERIAEDKTAGLALLRLYGARNLTAAPLAAEDGKGDDIMLVGIADPLAQAGGAAVTSAPAHVTAQGIEPAPKLGFSGAAALDAQGRLVGMVALKSPVVAGVGSVASQATLVPAQAIRAFLGAQGIALAGGHSAMDQSVVRIICVRK